jgi:hypothetical protein
VFSSENESADAMTTMINALMMAPMLGTHLPISRARADPPVTLVMTKPMAICPTNSDPEEQLGEHASEEMYTEGIYRATLIQ